MRVSTRTGLRQNSAVEDPARDVIAGLRHLLRMAHIEPVAIEDRVFLALEDRRVEIVIGGEREGALGIRVEPVLGRTTLGEINRRHARLLGYKNGVSGDRIDGAIRPHNGAPRHNGEVSQVTMPVLAI
jgi:hypothetical protein